MRRLAPCFLALMCVFCANLLQPPSARAIPGPCWYGIDVLPWDWIDCNFSNPLWVPSLTDGDPVNLATGGEEYAAPADLTAYNPNGPSAVFRRTYYSRLAMLGLSSAGLSAGWVSNYDYTIVPVDKTYDSADGPITTHYLRLAYPNGASETICADGAFSAPVGAPYVVDGTVGNSITVTWPNLTKWTFDYDAPVQKYYLRHIADRMGHAVYVHFDWNHLIDWISDETSGTHLLTFTYYGIGSGFEQALQTISDNHGRVVNFTPRLDPTANIKVLYRVSQVNNASSVRFDYEYVARTLPITGSVPEPFLHQILKPNPAGSNPPLTGVTVNYSTNPDPYTHEYPVTSVVDPNGNSRCYLYNDAYSPLAACRFGGTLIQVKNAQGTVIRAWLQEISYYGLSAGVYDSGRETSVEYNDPGNPLRPTDVSDRNGRYTNYQYDAFGRLIQVTVPSTAAVPPPPMGSGTVWFTSTVYSWTDSPTLGYPYPSSLSVQSGGLYYTDQQLTPTIFTFDPTQTSDPTHDHGLLTMVQWPIPGEVGAREWNQATFHYNGLGDVTQITKPAPTLQPSNTTITYGYASTPERGHPTSITVPLTATTNSVSSLAWNPTGTLASYTDALNHQTTFTYDDALKPLTVTYPPTGSNGSAYAKNTYQYTGGPLAGVSVYPEGTDPSRAALASVNYTYGPYGDLAARTGDTEPCYMTYDALYRLASLADGAGHAPPSPTQPYATTLNYTDSDDQTSAAAQFPLADTYSSSVLHTLTCPQADQFNPVVTNIDGKGVERDLVYDGPNGELTAINYPASAQDDIAYTYDLFDRVCTIRHGASDANYQDYTHYAYDDLGNVTQKDTYYNSGAVSGGISYAYYADGRRASMTTPAGTFNYYYNLAGQLTAMTSPTAGTTSWGYQNNGLLSWQSSGNYYLTSYSYDARGFVTQISNTSSNENLFADFSGISRDALGNITGFTATFPVIDTVSPLPPSPDSTRRPGGGISPLSITPPAPAPTSPYSGTTTYSYAHNSSDTADLLTAYGPVRLEQSTRFSGYTCAYAYDQAFNTTRIRGTGGQTYNSDNQRTGTGFAYDGNGNATTFGHPTWSPLQYDAENRLISFPTRFGTITATYDASGRRSGKTLNGVTTYYFYDGGIPVVEVNPSGTVTAVNTFGATGLVSRWSTTNGAMYYQFDPSGNVASYNSGTTGTPIAFDAYGLQTGTAPTGDPFGFQAQWGGYTDTWLGFVLMGHRYYDPTTCRWLTRDPIGYAGGINLYAYCGNNPVNRTDPWGYQSGECPEEEESERPEDGGDVPPADWNAEYPKDLPYNQEVDGHFPQDPTPDEIRVREVTRRVEDEVGKPYVDPHPVFAPKYPPNNGFAEPPYPVTLPSGTVLWRYGGQNGTFVTTPGTMPWAVSLPSGSEGWKDGPVSYTVTEPITVMAGTAAPWFGSPGGGVQYMLPAPIANLPGHLSPEG